MDWTGNRKVQFAVGLTFLIVVGWWLFTGDFLLAVQAFTQPPPAEGETQSVTVTAVLWPMLVEAIVIIGASIIAWALRLYDFLLLFYEDLKRKVTDRGSGAKSVSADSLATQMARAAALNDADALLRYSKEIRKPYAVQELLQAYESGDLDAAKQLNAELEQLVASKPTKARKVVSDE